MANPKKGSDDGVVTSAPSASVNSLLNDLLSEAKVGVDEEAKTVDNQAEQRERAARDLRDREEGKKREEAQQKLIEENRRRNEALARRERAEGEKKVLATAPHMRPVEEAPVPTVAAELKPAVKPVSKLLLAALVLGGLAVGLGGAFAMQPKAVGAFPDVDLAARAVVQQAARAGAAEMRITTALDAAQKEINDLNGNLGGAGLEAKKLRTDLEKLKADLQKTNVELAAAKEAAASAGTGRPIRRGNGNGGIPSLGGNVFK